jgi:hypothetical protein
MRERPSFVRARLVWGMTSAPLQEDLARAVEASVTQLVLLREDPRFVALLRETVEYAQRDAECHAAYARALAAAEAP